MIDSTDNTSIVVTGFGTPNFQELLQLAMAL